MPLSDIVNVIITRQTATVTETGFGTPMILGTSTRFDDLIRFYSSMDEVAVDFVSTDAEYIAAQDIFSQPISPPLIAIGRRQVDTVTVNVETAMPDADYSINIDGNEINIPSNTSATYSTVNLSSDLQPQNRISVKLNGTEVGTVTSIIDFDADFVASNSILAQVNGANLTPSVVYTTNQATTLGLVATKLSGASGVSSATVTGPRNITVVFTSPGNNTVNSVITTLGASQPVATISQGGFVYTTSSQNTMGLIATALDNESGIASATVSPSPFRKLTVIGDPNVTALINSFVVTLGATQPTATIVNNLQPVSPENIAARFVAAINADISLPVTAVDNSDGTFTITNKVTGIPYTLSVNSSIIRPISARVLVTQVSPNQTYTVTINGIEYSYKAPNNIQSAQQIVSALVDLINAVPSVTNVTAKNNNDGTFELSADNLSQTFSLDVTSGVMSTQFGLIVNPLTAVNPIATDLNFINDANDSWYALILTDRTLQTVKDAAAWIEAHIKLFGTASNDLNIINSPAGTDTTSIAAFLNQSGYVRTFVMYHQDALYDYPEAAWFGAVLPLDPGSETWKFKQLSTISYSNLTTTQSLNAHNKKANTYEYVAGVGITENGTVAQGEYIDTVRGIDWLTARMQEFVFQVLLNNPKVPYTDAGIASVQAEVMKALSLGVSNNFLSPSPAPMVTVPLAANVSNADKAARILRNVRFTATLTGAIHVVEIRGNLSL